MAEGYLTILEKYKTSLPMQAADREAVEKRAAQIRARYFLEEGKNKLSQREFNEARKLLAQANDYYRKSSLSLTVFGLGVAPGATAKLVSFWNRIRFGVKA
jgi:hypothetical protein